MTSDDSTHALLAQIAKNAESFFESAPCGYLFTLPDGLIIKANRAFLNWTGYSETELISKKRFQDVLTVGCKIYYETNYAPLLRMQGFLNEITLDLNGKEGRNVPVLINSDEQRDEAGKVLFIRSTLFNITDRKRYERELLSERRRAEHSELRFKLLARASELLRRSFDYAANFKELAEAATQDFCDGCTIDLIESNRLVRVAESHRVIEKKIPQFSEDAATSILTEPLLLSEQPAHFSQGSVSVADWLKSFINQFDPDSMILTPIRHQGKVIGLIGIYMTEMRRRFVQEDLELVNEIANRCVSAFESAQLHSETQCAHLELSVSHEWFSTTLKSIGDAVMAVNTDKTVSFLNTVAEQLTGWTSEEAKGRPMDEVFHVINATTRGPAFNPVEKVLKEGVIAGLTNNTALLRRDGTSIIIEDSAAPIRSEKGGMYGVVLVFRDITQKHEEEEKLNETLSQLQEERGVREKFVATLTHDLRNPITAVKMSAQLILRKTDHPAIVQTQAVRIINGVSRADQMIQDLLDANRIRAGEIIPLELIDCDLGAELHEVVNDLTTIHGDRFRLNAPAHFNLFCNSSSLRRVIENLCNNAVKYGGERTPIYVSLVHERDEAVISVRNEGNPIPPDDQATLFDPYRRTQSALQSGKKGWGLGLTLVRGVAEAHGGRVSVESSPEHGTTFSIHLPIL
ncbi:MAG: PAS domain S-box protein [Bdellovibrionia bacterium]